MGSLGGVAEFWDAAVTAQRDSVLQRLNRPAGTAKHRVSRTRHRILWVELWVGKILTGKLADFIEKNLATVR